MDGLLTAVSIRYKESDNKSSDEALTELSQEPKTILHLEETATTPEEALEILRIKPGLGSVKNVLEYTVLKAPISGFRIWSPSPLASQLVNVLVSETVPNYWTSLTEGRSDSVQKQVKKLLIISLRHVAGLNAIIGHLRIQILRFKTPGKESENGGASSIIVLYLSLLDTLLRDEKSIAHLRSSLDAENPQSRKILWRDFVTFLAGSKILNCCSEALAVIKAEREHLSSSWLGDGRLYIRWLSLNIASWTGAAELDSPDTWDCIKELLSKSLRLGFPDELLADILKLCFGPESERIRLLKLIDIIPVYDQRVVVESALRLLTKHYLPGIRSEEVVDWWKADSSLVSGAAKFVDYIISDDPNRIEILATWMTSLSGGAAGESIGIRRAAVVVISKSKEMLETVLDKCLNQFGDKLYIQHVPALQQEVHTQILLLLVGCMRRKSPLKIAMLVRSGVYLSAVSNRLSSSASRARYFGMLVGETISGLVHEGEGKMNFKMEELSSAEAEWYKSLVDVQDELGDLSSLIGLSSPRKLYSSNPILQKPPKPIARATSNSKVIAIEEVVDGESGDESGFLPYAKPDSDEEDSEEDATMVQRNKPSAPVYIRDLITFLRDFENYDRQKLGLNTAPQLIRRKANFGTEMTEHAEELASLLVGLQDKFELENFQDLRIQSMIAVLLSQPSRMAPWFSKTFFDGDFSLSQRAAILTVISIAARELGGFKDQDASLSSIKTTEGAFPSKMLPPKLHAIYAAPERNQIDALSSKLSQSMIQPLAAFLADAATGPDVLKVRTFSSRMAVESRRAPPKANALAAVVAKAFFFPLTGRFFSHLKAYGPQNVIFEPYLLSSYLKALSIIMHACGPTTLEIPEMTREMWDLLLGMRGQAQRDKSVGEAVLFGFLTLLEANDDKRLLAHTYSRELIETQRWVDVYFKGLGQGTTEDNKTRTLAASVLVKIQEVVEKYQTLLLGDLSSF